MSSFYSIALLAAATALVSRAQSPGHSDAPCDLVTRNNLVRCALKRSQSLVFQGHQIEAARARERKAGLVLPQNTVLSGLIASRRSPVASDLNWYVTLSQEIEIAGQRTARLEGAAAETQALNFKTQLVQREVVALAWTSYLNVAVATRRLAWATKAQLAFQKLQGAAEAMERAGIGTALEVNWAFARMIQADQRAAQAAKALHVAQATLVTLVGGKAQVEALSDLSNAFEHLAWQPQKRLELQIFEEMIHALEAKVSLLKRNYLPNPSLSLTLQNDGFREQVLGVGLSLPIPLPTPLGKSPQSDIDETRSQLAGVQAELEASRRAMVLEQFEAQEALQNAQQLRAQLTEARVKSAEQSLDQIASELGSKRLSMREALAAQESLLEILAFDIQASEALVLASLQVAKALGADFQGAVP
jgi:outer membrane protein, heavy metal efflux system